MRRLEKREKHQSALLVVKEIIRKSVVPTLSIPSYLLTEKELDVEKKGLQRKDPE